MSDEEIIRYVSRYGGKCRDCADENGVCPHSGAPCDTDQRRAIIAKTIDALRYGIGHRFIPNIFAFPSPETNLREDPIAWLWEHSKIKSKVEFTRPSRAHHQVGWSARPLFAATEQTAPPPETNLLGLEPIGEIDAGGAIKWLNPPIRKGTVLYAAPGSTLAADETECVCKRAVCSYDADFGCGLDRSKERQDV